jgi:peptidoglycan/LPS O-acetylase OafA/YrhL
MTDNFTMKAVFLGVLLGAFAVSLVNFLCHLAFARELFNDGLYIILYFFFVPQGMLLGGMTGYSIAAMRSGQRRQAGKGLLTGGALLIAAGLLFAFSYPSDHWDYLTGYFGVALVWAIANIIWGSILLKTHSSAM